MSPTNPDQPNSRCTILLATDNKSSVLAEVVGGNTNRLAYSAYGHQSAQQEVRTGLGFNGELREAQFGWYLLGNGYRAYNPRLMRFHSPDSFSPFGRGGRNAYIYCGGEPVMNKDPTGHFFVPSFTTLRNNLAAFVGRYQGHRAVGHSPVSALISTVSGNGGLPDTLGAVSSRWLQPEAPPTPVRSTAKDGGLHPKMWAGPSSTPAPRDGASNPALSRGGPGGGYNQSWEDSRKAMDEKPKGTIWTRYPKDVENSLPPGDRGRVKDIRDKK